MSLIIRVTVTDHTGKKLAQYTMDHDDVAQRRTLGEQCRNAFEAGQSICTAPVKGVQS